MRRGIIIKFLNNYTVTITMPKNAEVKVTTKSGSKKYTFHLPNKRSRTVTF
jgi:hypothetical protein